MTRGVQNSLSANQKLPVHALKKKKRSKHLKRQVELSEQQKRIIETAMAFPMEAILKRYAKDEELSWDVVLEHEREIKRYLTLAALNLGQPLGMAGPIDELWHTFIMFTREYHHFSMLVAGRYLHHVPVSEGEDPKAGRQAYRFFWKQYCAVYGEEPPAHLWPKLIEAIRGECSACVIECHGCGTDSNCNSCLAVPCGVLT